MPACSPTCLPARPPTCLPAYLPAGMRRAGCRRWCAAASALYLYSVAAAGAWGLLLVPGRLLAAGVEFWAVLRRLRQLLQEDAEVCLRRKAR